jgi:hypothetical protein
MVNQRSADVLETAGINGTFELELLIDSLLHDAGSFSLELPSCLTPEQRKCARLVVDKHPELKCESYGFGSDRRLHVFKKSATTCVRVKNTFVDGWEHIDGENDRCDAIIFRSVPGNLRKHAQLRFGGSAGDGRLELPPLCSATSRPVSPEGRPEPPPFPPGSFEAFPLGALVVIQGLVKAPAFNGHVGVAHSLDAETGRYDVLLASQSSGRQWAKVKYENLRLVPRLSAIPLQL